MGTFLDSREFGIDKARGPQSVVFHGAIWEPAVLTGAGSP